MTRCRFLLKALLALTLLVAPVAGCGGADGGSGTTDAASSDGPTLPDGDVVLPAPGEATVDTATDRTALAPGESVTVSCTVAPEAWAKAPTEVWVAGADTSAVVIDGTTVTFGAAGAYDVACAIAGTAIVDDTPVRVDVSTTAPRAVDTAVAPNPAAAGTRVTVTCTATNAAGEPAEAHFQVDVTPSDGVEADGQTLVVKTVGTYDVACRAAEGAVDTTPVRLEVEAGPIAKVTAQLADAEIEAGGSTTVACRATDAYGNGVSGQAFSIAVEEDVDLTGATIASRVAGLYEIGCVWAGGDDASIEHQNAELTVRPGPATVLLLEPTPDKPSYRTGNQVTFDHEVHDEFGNVVAGAAITEIAASPAEGLTRLSENAFRFTGEGTFEFSAALVDDPNVRDALTLVCDGAGPSVVIDYPLRGATIDGAPVVTVTGQVTDAVSGVATFTINGAPVAIQEDGAFAFDLDAVHGMNVIATEATDTAAQVERSWQSFYFSDAWYGVDARNPQGSYVTDGVLAFLGQETLDSSNPDAIDIAGVMESIVADMDILSLIPQPATVESVVWCTYSVYIDSLSFGRPLVSLTSFGGAPGGVHIWVELPNLVSHASVPGDGFGCVDVSANITADAIVLDANLYLEIDASGRVQSQVLVNSVEVRELDVDVDGVLGFLTNWLVNFFEGSISDMFAEQFQATIEQQVTDLLGSLFEVLALDQTFELGPFVGDNRSVVLRLVSDISTLRFDALGGDLRLSGTIVAEKVVSADPLGSIGRGACDGGVVGEYSLPKAHAIEAGLYDDLVNQALFSLWYGGGLDMVITADDLAALGTDLSSMGLAGLNVETQLLLPPILEGCARGEALLLQVGDAYVEASFDFLGQPVELGMYIQLAANATLVLVEGEAGPELGIQIGELQRLEVEVVSINEEQAGKEQQFADILKGVVPGLLADVGDEPITFALPSFDLSTLVEQIPAGTWVTVAPEALLRDLGYTVFAGHLAPGAPPAE